MAKRFGAKLSEIGFLTSFFSGFGANLDIDRLLIIKFLLYNYEVFLTHGHNHHTTNT
jgi:hypothetical protein